MSTRRYGNPPLVEALCQFQFEPVQEWDIAVPGLFYQKVQNEFPVRRQQKQFEVLLEQGKSEVKHQAGDRIQFLRPDGKSLLQVGPDLLIVNVLQPYPGWASFRILIATALDHYYEVAHPVSIKSLVLRYINRIDIPGRAFQIEEYLHFSPRVPDALPQTFVAWTASVAVPYSERELLRLSAGSSGDQERGHVGFVLDIEFVTLRLQPEEITSAQIDRAHEMIETAFEECITGKAREMFREEVPHEHAQL
jgi:uncharacterized protein (TIGR04255 family)